MPKLKVPGENPKNKSKIKRIKTKLLHVENHHGGGDNGDGNCRKRKRKLNGLTATHSNFYKIFGPSDDEDDEWNGFKSKDILTLIKENHSSPRPESPLSSSPTSPSPVSSPSVTPQRNGTTPLRKRGTRCMECKACRRQDDCGKCMNCIDKPKFGGPGSRKQACIHRKCKNLVRDTPLKSSSQYKRPPDHLYHPSAKRSSKSDVASTGNESSPSQPFKFRRFPPSLKLKDNSKHLIQLCWPDTPTHHGYPIYSYAPLNYTLCIKCGSFGHEKIIYCMLCCQPYHWFCAEVKEATPTFICPLCLYCEVCGKGDKCSQCTTCKKWFHKECLLGHASTHQADSNGELWKCVTCSKCISCHRNTPNKLIECQGYLSPLSSSAPSWDYSYCYCHECYTLKARGNCCPICGECYLDTDYNSKMAQCNLCDLWIHSHCEEMTEEEYEILTDLPETVEFTCRLCVAKRTTNEDTTTTTTTTTDATTADAATTTTDGTDATATTSSNGSSDGSSDGTCNGHVSNWRSAITQYKKDAFDKIVSNLKVSLESLIDDVVMTSSPAVSVAKFASLINEQLSRCGKNIQTGSHKHRLLYSSEQEYKREIEESFPWFVLDESTEKKTGAPPTDTPTSHPSHSNISQWPPILSHDHDYLSHDSHMTNIVDIKQETTPNPMVNGEEASHTPEDPRCCLLCSSKGDQPPTEAGRLLSCGSMDEWVHINCAIWSAEVYEDNNGVLCSVHSAIARGQRLRCDVCHYVGATVGCCHSTCSANYHYMCARRSGCGFLTNKEVYCNQHTSLVQEAVRVTANDMRVDHCVIIHTDNNEKVGRKITKLVSPDLIRVLTGSLCLLSLGSLTSLSDTVHSNLLISHQFSSRAYFWSTKSPHERTPYTLTISANLPEHEPLPLYTTPTNPSTLPTSPEDINWPCVTTEVGGRSGLWTSLSPTNHTPSINHSILKAAYAILKVSDGLPVAEALKTFRIPKKVQTKAINMLQDQKINVRPPAPVVTEKVESECLRRWEEGLPTGIEGVVYNIVDDSGTTWKGSDLHEVWSNVLSDLQKTRHQLNLPYISYSCDNVTRQFGLDQPYILQLLEQLPNREKCSRHTFMYHEPDRLSGWEQERTIINPTGSARSEGYNSVRSKPDMFSFLMSPWRPLPPTVDTESLEVAILHAESQGRDTRHQPQNDVPVAMRYRACQRSYRENVGVFVSGIHGLGLFSLQEIDSGDMVIEYAGTVIRSILTDYRERYYESRGIGCYMFRIDADDVVDATMSGNMARFINHSCDPNCYSKVVCVDGQKKIMIFALRKIVAGEELTYDYKFPIEDAKIPCKCGTAKCRKTLN